MEPIITTDMEIRPMGLQGVWCGGGISFGAESGGGYGNLPYGIAGVGFGLMNEWDKGEVVLLFCGDTFAPSNEFDG